jgi:hypothetical protein
MGPSDLAVPAPAHDLFALDHQSADHGIG